jgi:starch phosphorylase
MAQRATRRAAAPASPFDKLAAVAGNLWWSWQPEARAIFDEINPAAMRDSDNNPLVALRKMPSARKKHLAADVDFSAGVERVHDDLQAYLRAKTWYDGKYGRKGPRGVTAYFCMEYAVHESLPLYAGGLGVLAGDHLKSASDLGIPFVAVGIYWKKGYTRQGVDRGGRQTDTFRTLPIENAPVTEVCTKAGKPVRVSMELPGRKLVARAWRLDVGRVPLYLLDTDIPENSAEDRTLTHVLYSGDRDTRIRQEILLGIGGWRLLQALRLDVTCCHLNEGHAAFLSLERIAERMKSEGESYAKALRYVRNTSVFTTHTPIPAGNEEFDHKLVEQYFKVWPKKLGLSAEAFHDLARVKAGDEQENYGMTPLALRASRFANGVAALHGEVARKMWKPMYPGLLQRVPIGHVTNGIHLQTWLHADMHDLLDELLGPDWVAEQDTPATWAECRRIPDEAIWELHQQFKQQLIAYCRERLRRQVRAHGGSAAGLSLRDVDNVLDENALTIGFARRFAPYKRATLCFTDAARFAKILNSAKRPVQIIFAGKAHPADTGGKDLIAKLNAFAAEKRFRNRVVFLENYDMDIARHMVAGVDVWLNNPERPREASGTSGMKPALHGGLNLSILDGWWPEGFNGKNGWAIGDGEDFDGTVAAGRRDAKSLYQRLEKDVVPLFFNRDKSGLPRKWIAAMKDSLATIPAFFNTHRQVKEYLTKYYLPAMRKG